MKDFKVFTEHAELVAEWSKTLDELREKASKKKDGRDKPKSKKNNARLVPAVMTPDAEGLRVKDKEGSEYTVAAVDPPNVELEDPVGVPVNTTIAGMSKFRLD